MKTKLICSFVTFILTLSIVLSSCVISVFADTVANTATDVSDILSADAEFSNNKIIVVFDRKSSLELFDIEKSLFSSIECSDIHELTTVSTQKIENVKQIVTEAVTTGKSAVINEGEDYGYYRRMVCLELSNPGRENVIDAINSINKMDGVLCAIPNFKLSVDDSLSEIDNEIEIEQTPEEIYELIGLNDAWSTTSAMSKSTVRVAVIDTGIQDDHPALYGKIDEEYSAHLIGYSGDMGEYEEGTDIIVPIDDRGHGTHVAGIIGASYDSVTGTRGVSSTVEFVSIKILNERGEGELADLISAMEYVRWLDEIGNPVQVVNISASANDLFYELDNQEELAEAIFLFDGLVVCSAGNQNVSLTGNNRFPASLDGTNIITVGASTINDTRWNGGPGNGSNYNGSVDIFAPGVDIVSTVPTTSCPDRCLAKWGSDSPHYSDGYHAFTGTSMATPFVSGVAALLCSICPGLNSNQIKDLIMDKNSIDYSTNNSKDIHELYQICDSGGRVNAYKAVQAAIDYNTTPCTHSNATYTYTADTHTLTCPDCSYSLTEAHNYQNNTYNVNTHTLTCSVCFYSLTEAHNDFSYTYNTYTHSFKCSDCPYITGNAVHTGSYVTYNANTHTYSCSVCPYTLSSAHELYVYSDNGEYGVTIKCNQCLYEKFCDIGVAEYGYGGETGHYVDCTCGCYSFFTAHIPQFIMQTGSLYTHNVHCRDCNTVYPASHSWIPSGLGYECAMCAMTTLTIPDIMQIPSDDEILIASGDEIGTEIALLPEKEDDLVTE